MKVLILGANGQIARFAIELFLEQPNIELTLFARNASRLKDIKSDRVAIIEGDVLDFKKLLEVAAGHDVIYANLDGDMPKAATQIIKAMDQAQMKRLIFVSSMGIYDEVPFQSYKPVLNPYRDSALMIEKTNLDYTIIRPEWLNNNDEIDYETTSRHETFKNPEKFVSRKSVAHLIVKCATENYGVRESFGVNKP